MTLLFAYLLPLLLPTAIYLLWRVWRERAAGSATAEAPEGAPPGGAGPSGRAIVWRDMPWLWLALAGLVLTGLVVLIGAFAHQQAPSVQYVPPHLENGRVVPGEFRPVEPRGEQPSAQPADDPPNTRGAR